MLGEMDEAGAGTVLRAVQRGLFAALAQAREMRHVAGGMQQFVQQCRHGYTVPQLGELEEQGDTVPDQILFGKTASAVSGAIGAAALAGIMAQPQHPGEAVDIRPSDGAGDGEQRVIAQADERAAEKSHDGEVVARVANGLERDDEIQHLARLEEVVVAERIHGYARVPQRSGVDVDARPRAEQQRHVPPRRARCVQFEQTVRDGGGLHGAPLLRSARLSSAVRRHHEHLDGHGGAARTRGVHGFERYLEIREGGAVNGGIQPRACGRLHHGQDGRNAPEVVAQAQALAETAFIEVAAHAGPHGNVGPAEPVDALLRITDEHQARCIRAAGIRLRDQVRNIPLRGVRVLEFIDDERVRAPLHQRAQRGAVSRMAQHVPRPCDHAVEIDPALAGEPLLETPVRAPCQFDERGLVRRVFRRVESVQDIRLHQAERHGLDLVDAPAREQRIEARHVTVFQGGEQFVPHASLRPCQRLAWLEYCRERCSPQAQHAAAYDLRAEGMDRADPRLVHLVRFAAQSRRPERTAQIALQIRGRLSRERDGGDLRERDRRGMAFAADLDAEQEQDPAHDGERLAGAGTRLHEHVPVPCPDCLPLRVRRRAQAHFRGPPGMRQMSRA